MFCGLLLFVFSIPSFGCDCNRSVGYDEANLVFIGNVVHIKKNTKPYVDFAITFKVCTVEKGKLKTKRIIIYTPCLMDPCCGIPFKLDEKYRVYAYLEDNKLCTNLCTETSKMNE